MCWQKWSVRLMVGVFVAAAPALALGQYSQVTSPFNRVGDGFHERIGVGFGFNIRGGPPRGDRGPSTTRGFGPGGNIVFGQNGAGAALPPFGGHNPGGDAGLGIGVQGPRGGFNLNFFGSQGSDRSIVSESPTVVVPNGGTGAIFAGSQRPFVTSLVPVVGDWGGGVGTPPIVFPPVQQSMTNPLLERLSRLQAGEGSPSTGREADATAEPRRSPLPAAVESSAARGDASVAEIEAARAQAAAAHSAEVRQLLDDAAEQAALGNRGAAEVYLKMALLRSTDTELRQEISARLEELRGSSR